MSFQNRCPRCNHPLEIPKPPPESVRCGQCGASIKITGKSAGRGGEPSAEPPSTAPADTAGSPVRRSKVGIILAATTACLLAAGLGVWGYVALGTGSAAANKDAAPEQSQPVALNLDDAKPQEIKHKVRDPRVQKAIDAGVKYLKTQVAATAKMAKHQGAISLLGLTLLECGVPPDDPDVQKLAGVVRGLTPKMHETYSAAPAILFLDRLGQGKPLPDEDQRRIRSLTLRLIAGQHRPLNLWSYEIPVLDAAAEDKLFGVLSGKSEILDRPLGIADMSNTQFAALALWVGRKHDMPVDAALRAAATTARNYQNRADGTLPYHITNGQLRDTGTCVGLILMALGRAVAEDKDAAREGFLKDPAVIRSIKHLEQLIAAPHNHPEKKRLGPKKKLAALPASRFDSFGDLYFLWTLERTALILGLDKIGAHDWHQWGSDIVLDMQKDNGSWAERHAGVPDTCFALLFLVRANLFQDLTEKLKLAMAARLEEPIV